MLFGAESAVSIPLRYAKNMDCKSTKTPITVVSIPLRYAKNVVTRRLISVACCGFNSS